METKNIKTIGQLAEYINQCEEFNLEVSSIIEQNGWNDETGDNFGVCSDGNRRIIIDERSNAVVVQITYYVQETIGGWRQTALFSGTKSECGQYLEALSLSNRSVSIVSEDDYQVDYL